MNSKGFSKAKKVMMLLGPATCLELQMTCMLTHFVN